ncbi:MAG: TIGR00282 family metallophosphoesterase [Eubacteriales bacterium]|nr:TIGR00282 family metallophosphoesterase [Eubacteriales bacterium]
MRILILGDVIGKPGREHLSSRLFKLRKEKNIDFCVANGENSSTANGISPNSLKDLYNCGVDAVTTGNHCFRRTKDLDTIYNGDIPVVRPANFPDSMPGKGWMVVETPIGNVGIANVMGRIYMNPIDCPFNAVDKAIDEIKDKADIIIVDFHAEATSEKLAMLCHLDGRVTALVGTHTHIQTADDRVTENGTAYITDLGMTGPIDSILGVKKEIIYNRLANYSSERFENADGPCSINGVIIETDRNGKATSIERVIE